MGKPGFSILYIVTMKPRGETSICQQHQASLKQYFLSADAELSSESPVEIITATTSYLTCHPALSDWLRFHVDNPQLSLSLWTQEEIPISVYLYIDFLFLCYVPVQYKCLFSHMCMWLIDNCAAIEAHVYHPESATSCRRLCVLQGYQASGIRNTSFCWPSVSDTDCM